MFFYTAHAFGSTDHNRLYVEGRVMYVTNFVVWGRED